MIALWIFVRGSGGFSRFFRVTLTRWVCWSDGVCGLGVAMRANPCLHTWLSHMGLDGGQVSFGAVGNDLIMVQQKRHRGNDVNWRQSLTGGYNNNNINPF